MNPPDDFEQQLARRSRRAAPAPWRTEILSAANAASQRALAPTPAPTSLVSLAPLFLAWVNGFSPAWRALAGVWIVCLTVNHLTNDAPAGTLASRFDSGRLAPEQVAAARAQRRELLQLAGLTEPEPAEPPVARPPGPRSSLRRNERIHYA